MPEGYRYWEEKPHLHISKVKATIEELIAEEFEKGAGALPFQPFTPTNRPLCFPPLQYYGFHSWLRIERLYWR